MSNLNFKYTKALIADDESEVRSTIRDMLQRIGITRIYEAVDGNSAIKILDGRPESIDFIISDWNMPQKSGFEFLKYVNDNYINIPFIMITGRADHDSVLSARSSGVSSYIVKPFTIEELRRKIATVYDAGLCTPITNTRPLSNGKATELEALKNIDNPRDIIIK